MKMQLSVAQVLGKCLQAESVQQVFTLPGHGNIALLDGIIEAGIPLKVMHGETVAGHAADGYARASGNPGVLCTTCTPGAFNMMLAVTTAAMDCIPMVVITGDIPLQFAGMTCYEEFDQNGPDDQFALTRTMFKRAWKVTDPRQVPDYVAQAFNCATTGKPGPVLIDIPLDIHTMKIDFEASVSSKRRASHASAASADAIAAAKKLLEKAKRPVIFAGGGTRLSRAKDELVRLAEKMNAAVVCSMGGAGVFPTRHPSYAGTIGSYGIKTANDICREADVVLAVGTRFEESETSMWLPEYVFNCDNTKFLQIDIDPREVGKNYPVEVGIVGDAKTVLRQLADAIAPVSADVKESRLANLKLLAEGNKALKQKIEPLCVSEEIPISPRRAVRALEKNMPANATLSLDPSWCRVGILQQMDFNDMEDIFIVSGLLPIGWGSTAAVGISMARPDRKVISVTGDGGFLLNNSVVASAVEHNLPIIWIVMNNGGYNSLGVLSTVYFGKQEGSWFKNGATGEAYSPEYADLAKAYGAQGERVDDPKDLDAAMQRAFAANSPYLLDLRVSGPASRLVRTAQVTWDFLWEKATNKSAK
jgi:acetolactate synthase-1/2/3 large subunit